MSIIKPEKYSSKNISIMKKVRQRLHNLLHESFSRRIPKNTNCAEVKLKNEELTISKGSTLNSGDEDRDVLMDLTFQKPSKKSKSKRTLVRADLQNQNEERKPGLCYFQMPLESDVVALQRHLGLRVQRCKRDVVFLSLSLKTSKPQPESPGDESTPTSAEESERITEFAISTLDTRNLSRAISRDEPMERLLRTEYYIVDGFPNGHPQVHGEEHKCAFASAKHITARRAKFILFQAFKIRDEFANIPDGKTRYRDVVFVGCSPQFDRQILIDNGYELWKSGKTAYSLDLLPLTRWLYGHSEYLEKLPLMERFSLDAIMGELGFKESVRNAGDQAAYTLLAMLQLAIRSYGKRVAVEAGTVMVNTALMELVRKLRRA